MSNVSYDFTGRTAVVTGGAAGIGAEIARHYAAAGANVAIWDLSEPDDAPEGAISCKVDISDPDQIAAAVAKTRSAFGGVDFLSHNAGFAGPTLSVVESDPKIWARVVEVNLTGTFHLAHAIVPLMQEAGFGRIINMASLAGKEGTPNASAYSASKAGVIGFTKSMAKELAQTDIRVNCIAPAAIKTAILDQMTPEFVQIMVDKSPMKRLGWVEEAARMVMWLSSEDCTFNTGAVFDLSGGRATY
ncbi:MULTISPECIES: SDR family NAD(P)-dependent oxidoreductase [unclassified Ruegeria]|uniref:SDR family NAD(P)-dependent oxidoreductase n=1 Tax=unclassified Ruegeria TaxID=2625375 RepID=UPI001488F067|nr:MULTISPECIES: SDR family NAD(P)-dependent oxidoreductase [unclassified Ruegeria]NOD77641.1 SDR family oxidoreductase [Ruegeria sp. HKCCD4332]NOD89847.1 SDR family oxidoreductase [Ruegeria sp. HKCCD4318]NOE14707.1 SDR family oxidoreductase [Ruegeria sp. HKCCD4318-2]NOG10939.1 SDR family oxidoreductase [Ruegeria sp. HKCCD4315]